MSIDRIVKVPFFIPTWAIAQTWGNIVPWKRGVPITVALFVHRFRHNGQLRETTAKTSPARSGAPAWQTHGPCCAPHSADQPLLTERSESLVRDLVKEPNTAKDGRQLSGWWPPLKLRVGIDVEGHNSQGFLVQEPHGPQQSCRPVELR